MKAHFWQMHWGRVLLTDVLVIIIVVILNMAVLLLASSIWGPPFQTESIYQITSWSTSLLAILLTAGGAVWVARTVERETLLHGLLVGMVVGLILLLLGLGFGTPLLMALLTFVLNMAFGFLGGILGSRGR